VRSTSLETWTFFGDFLGPTVVDEIRAWNLTPHSDVRFSANLPSGIRKSTPWGLGLDFLDSSSSLTLFGSSTSPHPFLAAQLLALSAPFTIRHRSDPNGFASSNSAQDARLNRYAPAAGPSFRQSNVPRISLISISDLRKDRPS
jgi:hypothetical protein